MSSSSDISDILVQHYMNSASEVFTPSVPNLLSRIVSSILVLRNPQYPNHFTNATYVLLSRELDDLSEADEAVLATFFQQGIPGIDVRSPKYRFIDMPCPFRNSKFFSSIQAGCYYRMKYRCRNDPEGSTPPKVLLDDDRYHCVEIVDGADYFRHRFPAKATLADKEETLAITLISDREDENPLPAGHAQYITSSDSSRALITGLEVHETFRGKGLAKRLLHEVRMRLPTSVQLWIQVSTENFTALGLYLRNGFDIESMAYDADLRLLEEGKNIDRVR